MRAELDRLRGLLDAEKALTRSLRERLSSRSTLPSAVSQEPDPRRLWSLQRANAHLEARLNETEEKLAYWRRAATVARDR